MIELRGNLRLFDKPQHVALVENLKLNFTVVESGSENALIQSLGGRPPSGPVMTWFSRSIVTVARTSRAASWG